MQQVMETLHALCEFPDHQKVVLWPNSDAGSEDVAKGIRSFRERGESAGFHFYRNLTATAAINRPIRWRSSGWRTIRASR
jgi:hypothetical protein